MKTKTKLLAYFGFAMLALCLMSNAGRTYATHYIHVSTGGLQEVTVRGNRESAVVSSDSINVKQLPVALDIILSYPLL